MNFKWLSVFLLIMMYGKSEAVESALWHVSPDVCIAQGQMDNCLLTVTIKLQRALNGNHCLYLDSQRLQCFDTLPQNIVKDITLKTSALLNLLDDSGLTVAEQQIVIQYLKRKRRRTRAPWSLF